jgi:hypothetical protein
MRRKQPTASGLRGPSEEGRGAAVDAGGVMITLRLVAPAPGRASGTFDSVGALAARGTVVTDAFVPAAPAPGTPPALVEGVMRLLAHGGEVLVSVQTVLRPVPGTGVLSGGGSWNVTEASGDHDGLRAGGTLTLVAVYDAAGTATVDVVLTGRVPAGSVGKP